MARDLFTIKYKDNMYKCYLDAEGELWVIDDQGNTTVIATFKHSPDVKDARESVLTILEILGW